jgi:hypothetical protein
LFIHAPTGKSVGSNSNNTEPTDLPVGLKSKEPTDLPVGARKKETVPTFETASLTGYFFIIPFYPRS